MAVKATFGNTMGAIFLGTIGSAILSGAILVQIFMYYRNFSSDRRLQKFFVGMLLALTVVHLAFAIYTIYFHLIVNFGNTSVHGSIDWSFKVETSLDAATVPIVQGLYAWRVQTLAKHYSRVWPWVVVAIVGVGWVLAIVLPVELSKTQAWQGIERIHSLVLGSLTVPLVIDTVISGTVFYYVQKNRSIFTKTNSRVLRIMYYVIICGFLTSACALAALICLATMPDTLIYLGIEFLLPRLYIFSYMALLNARKKTAEGAPPFKVSGLPSNLRPARNSTWSEPEKKPPSGVETDTTTSDQDAIRFSPSKFCPGVNAPQQVSLQHHTADMGV